MARKPTIKKGPASLHAGPGETIVEVWSPTLKRGCLISIREAQAGGADARGAFLVIEPYRGDAGVFVRADRKDHEVPR